MEDEFNILKAGIVFYKIFSYIKGHAKLLQLVHHKLSLWGIGQIGLR